MDAGTGGLNNNNTSTTTIPIDELSALRLDGVVSPAGRRASPLVVRMNATESPMQQRNATTPTGGGRNSGSNRIRYEDLVNRPRSNPRSRTPMRYESPMNQDEFRRTSITTNEVQQNRTTTPEARRVTIRPMAGRAVGTTAPMTARERQQQGLLSNAVVRSTTPVKSHKQGPSQRKVRRWNHENFINLAADLLQSSNKNASSDRSRMAADAILKAKAEAHLYKEVYNPNDKPSKSISTLIQNDDLRTKFFNCELPVPPVTTTTAKDEEDDQKTPQQLLQRIDGRLRRVVKKACENSYPACKVIESFEEYFIRCFHQLQQQQQQLQPDDVMDDVLMTAPKIIKDSEDNDNHKSATTTTCSNSNTATTKIQLLFDGECQSGGFHRLLVHAVCQFHGLKVVSSTSTITNGNNSNNEDKHSKGGGRGKQQQQRRQLARVLTVSTSTTTNGGKKQKSSNSSSSSRIAGPNYRLLDHILDNHVRSNNNNSTVNVDVPNNNNNANTNTTTQPNNEDNNNNISNTSNSSLNEWEFVEKVSVAS